MTQVFLALDFVVGAADQNYARSAVENVLKAIYEARRRSLPVIFSKIGFRPGYPDVSKRNAVFSLFASKGMFVGDGSRLVDAMKPRPDEPLIDKKRFSAFAGSGLWTLLHSQEVISVVMAGVSTSGVVLSTALELLDADIEVVVLSDACTDSKRQVHDMIMGDILGSRTRVCTVADWIADPTGSKNGKS